MIFKLQIDKTREEEIVATVHARSPLTDEIEKLVLQDSMNDKIPGYDEDEIVMLDLDQIECFYAEADRAYAVCGKKKYMIHKRLYELEKILPKQYERISKSAIANWNKIGKFKVQLSGVVNIVFKSGYTNCISRRCFAELKRRYHL